MSTTLPRIATDCYCVTLHGDADCLWRYQATGSSVTHAVAPPVFEIDGQSVPAVLRTLSSQPPVTLRHGVVEHRVSGTFAADPTLNLELVFRVAQGDPVVRFRYALHSTAPRRLTKTAGADALTYLGLATASCATVTEVRFSEFSELVHSFCLVEEDLPDRQFENACQAMGPMLVGKSGGHTFLVAYEHGSQVPDAFLAYHLTPDRRVALRAVKGNYFAGQPVAPGQPFETIWLQFAAMEAEEPALAAAYRRFVLLHQTENLASRTPYIFYNTWAYQERNQAWNNRPYLESMCQERILAEIDIAHRMGIDVFVLDTGWYEKTGDWRVNTRRFPDNLQAVKEKLDGYGMKLGLWFGPLHAALTSAMHHNHPDCIMSWQGTPAGIHQIWETEESQNLCLVSRYADAFADELIRLVKEVGVTYFKWDAIGQYGCDDPGHGHGDAACSAQDRADSYAFQLGQAMVHVVNRLCAACPEAIVDFDITEGGRYVGLGFLGAGKFFLINNGPYYGSYNIPGCVGNWGNIFVYPGQARAWVCRTPLTFDKWIPSVLFLTHYLPDDPAGSQLINIASLILGQNGIWGDLLTISDEGVGRFGRLLGLYKQVRDEITASAPVFTGHAAGSPEIYEKLAENGRGAVVIFSSATGRYTYVTAHTTARSFDATDGTAIRYDTAGRAVIDFTFDEPGAKIVFFGVTP